MRNRHLRIVLLALLAPGSVLAAASPALAEHTNNGFRPSQYEVAEAAGYVELSVWVNFVPMGQGQIDYYTSDLTAVAGRDYQETSGTVTFVSGTYGRQDIKVPINNDEVIEDEERFEVKLTNYRGSFVERGHETALVRIRDDDSRPSSSSSSPAQSSIQAGTGGASPPPQAGTGRQAGTGGATPPPQAETRPTEVSRPDRDAASTELQPGPGFELIGSDPVSGPAARARLPEDKGGIMTNSFLVLAAVIVSGGGAWIWRRRSSW